MSVIIRLQNLPLSAAASDVRAFFAGLKIPDGAVHIIGGPEGDVFVGFASDEDARQAMRRDRLQIHGSEIRLFLSSKTEMNTVIEQARTGLFASQEPEPTPQNDWKSNDWQTNEFKSNERAPNLFAARPGYSASYPPQKSNDYNAPIYSRNGSQHPPEPERQPPIEQKRSFPNNQPTVNSSRFSRPIVDARSLRNSQEVTIENKPPKPESYSVSNSLIRPVNGTNGSSQNQYQQIYDNKPLIGAPRDMNNRQENVESESWRDSSYKRVEPSKTANLPVINDTQRFNGRKTLISNVIRDGTNVNPTSSNNSRPATMTLPTFGAPKPLMDTVNEKFYIELTRLPTDLLRPAGLEEFIRPSVPLTLSSAKCVFGPGGVHVHTLIRLDSHEDFWSLLKRDGEQGIKIRKSSKAEFDEAVEGIPVATTSLTANDDRRRRRSRSRSRSPRRRSPRRRSPDRRRNSRSPIRKRRRSMSPDRDGRRNHTDPTRWCLQLTNVPFRIKEEDLIEWFSEKVKPAKLTRTFYADGNASDRWVAEFSSESLMERAFSIRSLCAGRTIRMCYITNEKADEILKIEDRYGFEKKSKSEELKGEVDKKNPLKFFNNQPIPKTMTLPPTSNGMNGSHPIQSMMPSRGSSFPSQGFQPNSGMMGGRGGMMYPPLMPHHSGFFSTGQIPPMMNYRGSFRGGRGMFGGRGNFHGDRMNRLQTAELNKANVDFANTIGPKGTVIMGSGFPQDVTLEEVMILFKDFDPIQNSIRIRRGEDGELTGECMLACRDSEKAAAAVRQLNKTIFRDFPIHISIANS